MKKSISLQAIVFGALYLFVGGLNAATLHKNLQAHAGSVYAAGMQSAAPVMGLAEFTDLKLKDVLKVLDCSQTVLGQMKLGVWLADPMTRASDLRARQATIRGLVDDQKTRVTLNKTLQKISASERDFLSYFQQNDALNKSVQYFYFSFLPKFLADFKVLTNMQKSLNNNTYTLGGAMVFSSFRSLYFLAQSLCLSSVFDDWMRVVFGGKEDFILVESLIKAFKRPFMDHNPFQTHLSEEHDRKPTIHTYNNIIFEGSLGDRFKAFTEGYNRTTVYNFGIFSRTVENEALGEDSSTAEKIGSIIGGASAALALTAWRDYNLYNSVKNSYQEVANNKEIAQKLRIRLDAMAELVKNIDALHVATKQSPLFAHSGASAIFDKYLTRKEGSKKMQELLNLLRIGFESKLPAWYPTGSMLLAQKMLHELSDELGELLFAVGEIDAYMSIAQLYLRHQDSENKICFVDFIEDEAPQLNLQDVWIPSKIKLINMAKVVTNTIELGCAGAAAKMILTGPNGCGKSTLLKPLGQAVALAQGWTIAPAREAQMTVFHAIYTCFDADEDGPAGMSTFMAVDKKMVELQSKLDAAKADNKCLALIDEPWRGTVDAASAKYIYDFGKHVASLPHCIVCLATHVQKPVDLARDTDGAFRNMQVTINRGARSNEFERTFKLADGPANWWFNDEEMRSDFIDWLKQFYGAQKASA